MWVTIVLPIWLEQGINKNKRAGQNNSIVVEIRAQQVVRPSHPRVVGRAAHGSPPSAAKFVTFTTAAADPGAVAQRRRRLMKGPTKIGKTEKSLAKCVCVPKFTIFCGQQVPACGAKRVSDLGNYFGWVPL